MRRHLVSVRFDDDDGLADVTETLSNGRVPIAGFAADTEGLRFLTDSADTAIEVLQRAGWSADVEEVAEIELANRTGELSVVCRGLRDAGIRVRHAFGMTQGSGGVLALAVDDIRRAAPVLERVGMGSRIIHAGLRRIG